MDLFHRARELPSAERDRFLDRACAGEPKTRESVEALLAGDEAALTLLDEPGRLAGWLDDESELDERRIGPFLVEAKIGEGGMGVVYRARQEGPLSRTVALKLVRPGWGHREILARFELERRTLAVLDHPNIAKVFDAGTHDDGRPYFVMEWVDGLPLTTFCDRHRLPLAERLRLFLPICRAVHHAHQKGIIHRDLKPSNVLVALQDGVPTPRVIDFGVARAVEDRPAAGTSLTEHGRLVGTPGYMAPEQATPGTDIDIRADIYSLGVMLYELLVGSLPLPMDPAAVDGFLDRVRGEEPKTPSARVAGLGAEAAEIAAARGTDRSSLRRELRGDLDWITMRALEKERKRRYGAASELAQEIERSLDHQPVMAGPPSGLYRLRKLVRRHRLEAGAVVGVLLLALAFALYTRWQARELGRALARAEEEGAKSEQVASLLVELFRVSDPREARGEEILAREILARGTARIEDELVDQPAVRAEMLGVMGEVYTNLGLFAEAEPLLQQSLELSRTRETVDSPRDLVEGYLQLAALRYWQGAWAEAEELLRTSLSLLDADRPEDRQLLARNRQLLAEVLIKNQQLPESEALLRAALELSDRPVREERRRTGRLLFSLGFILMEQARFAASEAALRRSLEIGRETLPADDPSLGRRLEVLAIVLQRQGRNDEAEALAWEAVDRIREAFGDHHPQTAAALNNLALRLEGAGKTEGVEELYLEALEAWPEEHPEVPALLSNLGAFYRRRGRLDDAIEVLQRAVDVGRRTLGDSPTLARAWNNLGVALDRNGEEGAEAAHREALRIRLAVLGEDHLDVAASLGNLAGMEKRAGRLSEAENLYRRATTIEEARLGRDHAGTFRNLYNLAVILRRRGSFEEAESLLRRTVEIQRRAHGDDHPDTAFQLAALGRALTEAGRSSEGEPLLRRALEIQNAALPPDSYWTALSRFYLGNCLLAEKQYAEAEEHLLAAAERIEAVRGVDGERTLEVRSALDALYREWPDPD